MSSSASYGGNKDDDTDIIRVSRDALNLPLSGPFNALCSSSQRREGTAAGATAESNRSQNVLNEKIEKNRRIEFHQHVQGEGRRRTHDAKRNGDSNGFFASRRLTAEPGGDLSSLLSLSSAMAKFESLPLDAKEQMRKKSESFQHIYI